MSANESVAGSMASDLCALLDSGDGADVTLVVGEREMRAHSFILAARSPVFAALLRRDSRRIEIADVQEQVLQELLLFLYGDQTPQLESVAAELLAAAEKYQLPLLKERCEQQMMRDITVENAAATAALAVQYSCLGLKNAAVEFIASHTQVMGTQGWRQLLLDSVEAAVEICSQLAVSLPPRVQPQPSPLNSEMTETSTVPDSRKTAEELKQDMAARLIAGARDGSGREVWALLTAGAPRDARDESGNTALHLAAANGHASSVKFLIDGGLDVNAVNSSGRAPLHLAAQRGDLDIIWMLVAASARVDVQDGQGKTPLHLAAEVVVIAATCERCRVNRSAIAARAAVGALLLAGARQDIQDGTGETPQSVATGFTTHAFTRYSDLS